VRLIVKLRRRHVWQKEKRRSAGRLSVVKQQDTVPRSNETHPMQVTSLHVLRPNLFWVKSAKLLTQEQCADAIHIYGALLSSLYK
jgi:hypothetical protein